MLVANVRLKLDKLGQDVFLKNVTPAEAAFLVAEHQACAGEQPLKIVGEPVEEERSSISEINRLYGKYLPKKIRAVFPSASASVPENFDVAIQLGMGTVIPTAKLLEMVA